MLSQIVKQTEGQIESQKMIRNVCDYIMEHHTKRYYRTLLSMFLSTYIVPISVLVLTNNVSAKTVSLGLAVLMQSFLLLIEYIQLRA